jgi:hypothetical protein
MLHLLRSTSAQAINRISCRPRSRPPLTHTRAKETTHNTTLRTPLHIMSHTTQKMRHAPSRSRTPTPITTMRPRTEPMQLDARLRHNFKRHHVMQTILVRR